MLKLLFLFLAVMWTLVNTARFIGKQDIPALNFILQAIGITGFIWLQWLQ